jgi:hypothetical protein
VEPACIATAGQVIDSTQCAGVENARSEREVIQQGRQAIGHLDTLNQIIGTNYIKSHRRKA